MSSLEPLTDDHARAAAPRAVEPRRSRPIARPRASAWYHGLLWSGMNLRAWLRLLARNRFAVRWTKWPTVACITLFAACNTLLGWLERLVFARRVAQTPLHPEPIFILGHWRTGTTLLHELLALDPRHTAPTTYQCLAPNHFLLSHRFVARFMPFLLPRVRPMDDMRMGFDRPQEDESALCGLGLPSPFLSVAFPGRPTQDPAYVDMDELPPADVARWTSAWRQFLRRVTFRRPGRLVLKSPQHTFRLPTLLETFPQARFVCLVRDPVEVFPSTLHFWQAMHLGQSLGDPTCNGLDEQIFETFLRMHRRVEQTRHLVQPMRFYELRYEDLIADPEGELRRLYQWLDLGDFEPAAAPVRRYLAETTDYRQNRYRANAERDALVRRRWQEYAVLHGYAADDIDELDRSSAVAPEQTATGGRIER